MANILLVEDNTAVRSLLNLLLEREGHTVVQGGNGVEGLEQLRTHSIDLVITDLVMPEKEGLEMIIEVRRSYPWLKVIAISGGGTGSPKPYLNMAKCLGAQRILLKPFSNDDLLKEVRECLQK